MPMKFLHSQWRQSTKTQILLSFKLSFLAGLTTGMFFATIIINISMFKRQISRQLVLKDISEKTAYGARLLQDKQAHNDEDSLAKKLMKDVRVLIFIETRPSYLMNRSQAVKDTWGKRCSKLIFFSSENNTDFPTIGLPVEEGRKHLTAKTMNAFRYIYDHYFDTYDWFMKADDDTYVIVENLHYFLSGENSSKPVYLGHHFKRIAEQGYNSGGAGYVLSKEALRRFGEQALNSSHCHRDGGSEDVAMGLCLESLGVKVGNSTDSLGRTRFHCFGPEMHMQGNYPKWYPMYDSNSTKTNQENMSDYAITFHYISPFLMRMLDFYTYHLRPFGVVNREQKLNRDNTES